MDINLKLLEHNDEMEVFWELFNTYIDELAKDSTHGDGIDLEYYYSEEYRGAIDRIRQREKNPIRINFILNEDKIAGFAMCQFLYNEGNTCALMEFYLIEDYRNKGIGKKVYQELENYIVNEGLTGVELTPTNSVNQRFWESVGYSITDETDEENKRVFKKKL